MRNVQFKTPGTELQEEGSLFLALGSSCLLALELQHVQQVLNWNLDFLRSYTFLVLLNVEPSQEHDCLFSKQSAIGGIGWIYVGTIDSSVTALSSKSGQIYSVWIERTPPVPPKRSLLHP